MIVMGEFVGMNDKQGGDEDNVLKGAAHKGNLVKSNLDKENLNKDNLNKDKTVEHKTAPIVNLTGERDRLLNEKKIRQEADLQQRFQKAMGWDKKIKKTKSKKKRKKKKKR